MNIATITEDVNYHLLSLVEHDQCKFHTWILWMIIQCLECEWIRNVGNVYAQSLLYVIVVENRINIGYTPQSLPS